MKTIELIRTENLKNLIKKYGSVNEFANAIDRGYSQISQWINNSKDAKSGKPRTISTRSCRMIEEKLLLQQGWFDTNHDVSGVQVVGVDDSNPPDDAVQIRRIKFEVSAGISGVYIDQREEEGNPIYFRIDWLRRRGYNPEKLVATYIKGESMEPGMHEGDTIVINTADTTPKDGRVFVLRYENETVVKRFQRDAGKWWLSSDNPDKSHFPRKEALPDICEIIGEVIHKQSEKV